MLEDVHGAARLAIVQRSDRGPDLDAVLAAGVLQPHPQVMGERAGDVDVEGGAARLVVVDQVDQDGGLGEQALCAAADREPPRMEVERAPFGQHVARARAGDAKRDAGVGHIGDRAVDIGKGVAQGADEAARLLRRAGQQLLIGAEPE